jgi:hypothetical protein
MPCGKCDCVDLRPRDAKATETEMVTNFGDLPPGERLVVCDDCFQAMEMRRIARLGLRE